MNGKEENWYWELIIKVETHSQDLLSWFAFENGATGVEELTNEADWVTCKYYFSAETNHPGRLFEQLDQNIDVSPAGFEVINCEKKDVINWQDNWRTYFKPLRIGRRFLIRPSWEKAQPDYSEIVIYPGQGFGTGYHESTKIALELLEWLLEKRSVHHVIDVGAGSGVLTIGALLLDVQSVMAIDIDECILEEIPRNIGFSGLQDRKYQVQHCDVSALDDDADLVMANIEDHILMGMRDKLVEMVKPKGYLLLSGILDENKASLISEIPPQLEKINEQVEKEWYGVVFQRDE